MKRRRQLAIGPRGELIILRDRRRSDLMLNWIACCIVGSAIGLIVGLLILAIWATPAGAATCHHEPGDDGAWTWRNVDGSKCWYEGHHVIAKDQLHWPIAVRGAEATTTQADHDGKGTARTVGATPATAAPSWLERVSDKAPPAEIYFPAMIAGNILESYPLVVPQPWLSPDTVMHWPLLLDVDQRPFAAWTKRIAQ